MAVYTHLPTWHPPAAHHDPQARRVGSRNGYQWSHLTADTDEELNAFARRLGLKPEWKQDCHFDITPRRFARARELRAIVLSYRDACLKIAALRRLARAAS